MYLQAILYFEAARERNLARRVTSLLCAVAGACACLAGRADALVTHAVQNDITIQYNAQVYTLGSFVVDMSQNDNPNFVNMAGTFTVNTGLGAPPVGLFSRVRFSWY